MKNNKFSLANFKGLESSEMSTINGGVHGVEPDKKYSTNPLTAGGDTDCKDLYNGGPIYVYE